MELATTTSEPTAAQQQVLGSVVIPAYNEAAVIQRCLDALFTGIEPNSLEVLVVCNGCVDDTAEIARSSGHPVRVLELERGSKCGALNLADATLTRFPRVYLDADVELSGTAVHQLLARLAAGVLAVRPPVRYDSERSSAPVRAYYRTRAGLPIVDSALWGAHVYGLSAEGRARFGEFPESLGEDLWLDRGFARDEIEIVDCEPVVIPTSRRARDLIYILRRMYRSKEEEMPAYAPPGREDDTRSSTMRDLRAYAARGPREALDAGIYCGFAVAGRIARVLAARSTVRWERDESVRA